MRKFRFCVIYIEDNKLKHKQISSYSAFLACEDFKELKPNAIVLEAGLGSVSKEGWKNLKAREEEIVKEIIGGKDDDTSEAGK